MKNLFLIVCMFFCFAIASAQETPQKKKSSTKTDTVYSKKNKKQPSTQKTDTVHKQHTDKKKGTKKSTTKTTKDTITGTMRP